MFWDCIASDPIDCSNHYNDPIWQRQFPLVTYNGFIDHLFDLGKKVD